MALDLKTPVQAPPPAKRGPGRPRKVASETTQTKTTKLAAREEAVGGIFQMVSFGLLMAGQVPDAGAVAEHGPKIATQTAILADDNEGVAKIVDFLTAVGPYAGLFSAVLPLALQILVNHGRVPMAPMLAGMGVKDPLQIRAEYDQQRAQQMAEWQALAAAAERERQSVAMENVNGSHAAND